MVNAIDIVAVERCRRLCLDEVQRDERHQLSLARRRELLAALGPGEPERGRFSPGHEVRTRLALADMPWVPERFDKRRHLAFWNWYLTEALDAARHDWALRHRLREQDGIPQ